MRWVWVTITVTLLVGCASIDFKALNDRHVKSCWRYQGAYGLFASATGFTLTGGMTVEECRVLFIN